MAFVRRALVCLLPAASLSITLPALAQATPAPALIAQAAPASQTEAGNPPPPPPASASPMELGNPAPPTGAEGSGRELAAPPPAKTPPPPYSLPWQLRPIIAPTVLRSDSSVAAYEDGASQGGVTFVTSILASYKIPGTGGPGSGLAPMVRFAMVNDSPPTGPGGLAVVNPLVGAAYAVKLPAGFRMNFFLGATVPVGMGGGDAPDPGTANSRSKGAFARSAMDNALFAVNDFTVIPGFGVGYVGNGFTVQAEATLLQLTRVRAEKAQAEASKTNFTSGLHFGYFVSPQMSIGADLRYQRWFDAPIAVEKDATNAARDTATFAIGPRFHFKVAESTWVRPGVSYSRGLDKPIAAAAPNYQIVQVDVPVVF